MNDGPAPALKQRRNESAILDFVARDGKESSLTEVLDNAQEHGITLVSMKRDWKIVFRGERTP